MSDLEFGLFGLGFIIGFFVLIVLLLLKAIELHRKTHLKFTNIVGVG